MWEDIATAKPEVAIIMPCGFSVPRTLSEIHVLDTIPQFKRLPAFRQRRVYVVDGSAYFNRAGPRLIDGAELLAGLIHSDLREGPAATEAALALALGGPGRRLRFRPIEG
jgi:iron complex transport system substrate-binding protein